MNTYTVTISLLKRNGITSRTICPKETAEVMLLNNITSDNHIETFLIETKNALRAHLGFVLGFAETPMDITLESLSDNYHHETFKVKSGTRPALFKEETEQFLVRLRRSNPDKFKLFKVLDAIVRIECDVAAVIETVTIKCLVEAP